MRDLKKGTIVKHFKYETLTPEEKEKRKYLCEVIGKAKHTETGEDLMVYLELCEPCELYARPLAMFYGKVDTQAYPDIKQVHRFEEFSQSN